MVGFMVDGARALENRGYYRRFIEFIAERGADTLQWHFSDDQGCAIRFDSLPAAASPNAYSKEEVRELVAFARGLGINVIPELATLGHTRYITGVGGTYAKLAENDHFYSSICPVAPLTCEVVGGLLDEVIDLFDSPIIHVGLDETNLGGHPLTAEALKTRETSDLFVEHALFLHDRITRRGRRMMMWGDCVAEYSKVANVLPKDILVGNWQYDPVVTLDRSTKLTAAGFEVIACPALFCHNQTIVAGESWAYPNVRALSGHRSKLPGVTGTMTTLWTPTRFISESIWPAVDYAAAVMHAGGDVNVRDQAAKFGETFFGLRHAKRFAAAIEAMADAAPERARWLPICLLKRGAADASDFCEQVSRFKDIASRLSRCRSAVRRNQEVFAAIQLTADLLALAWSRAAVHRDGAVTTTLLDECRQMSGRLAAAWDRERFADDPRRDRPASVFDEQEHLRWTFDQGTAVLARAADLAGHLCGPSSR
jgi:hypothetical protein